MVFSSSAFIFGFLPIFLTIYFLAPAQFRNGIIMVGSLMFYFVDGGILTTILCCSIVINYYLALYFYRSSGLSRKLALVFGVAVNLIPLLYYKYGMFFIEALNDAIALTDSNNQFQITSILLPAGISFYTFHALSYLLDVYYKKVNPETSLVNFGMYMSNFPQLIAGPIVRYSEIVDVIRDRKVRIEQIYSGLFTFGIGLAKKIVLADNAGKIADGIFGLPPGELTIGLAWLGAFAYSMQIYFDFSGYSDMAIGLGRIMGFEFPKNFNQPYRSKNITEFWRRWHMTLSRWFRDYLYIPLGGNRKGSGRTLFNLFFVFFLCGLWHGAAYGFIVWGIYHGVLLVIERILKVKYGFAMSGILGQLQAFILVMIGWVFFRAESLPVAVNYLSAMVNILPVEDTSKTIPFVLGIDQVTFLIIASICAVFPVERLREIRVSEMVLYRIQAGTASILLAFSCMLIAANGFNPFIYFRF